MGGHDVRFFKILIKTKKLAVLDLFMLHFCDTNRWTQCSTSFPHYHQVYPQYMIDHSLGTTTYSG